ncbi:MAG: O-antigen ligase family protein [Porphyromonadaceae bacterium]|nr:O-antigen ligase family protein [Porphyromonadaceae bacterium]
MKVSPILFVFSIFFGSVFLTSGKFVDTTNTPKFYFSLAFVLVFIIINARSRKPINIGTFTNKTTLWGIYSVCFLQACYGLFQLAGWFPSNHSEFVITGSFDNPAGFTAVLSLGFPIGLILLAKAKKVEWYLTVAGLVVIAMAVFFSGSRAGMLAMIISSGVFLLLKTNITGKFQQLKYYKLLLVLFLGLFIGGVFIFYYQKKDSANGRLLIWKVSFTMIKDKPILGHGIGAFQSKYMDYQAEYFENNPDSKFKLLADNVKHPFNEFIKVAVEFGIAGLAVVLSVILFVLWKIIKSKNDNRGLVLSGLTSFFVFACFSYPLQYVATWLFLAFYLTAILSSQEIRIRNTPVSVITRVTIVVACIFGLSHLIRQVEAEKKWKTIAISSLRGNTGKMLPEYRKLYLTSFLKRNPFFLYNYGAELNVAGKYEESIDILSECQKQFNDYDLQMLMADNYYEKGETEKAIQAYQHASNMIPCRFLPIYQLFKIYREKDQKEMAVKYATEIINKNVKVPSVAVSFIQREASEFLTGD